MRYVSTRGEGPAARLCRRRCSRALPATAVSMCRTPGRALDAATIAGFAGQALCRRRARGAAPLRRRQYRGSRSRPAWRARPMAASAIRPPRRSFSLRHRPFVLELFHGPTLAFKDVAMQLLARLMDHVLQAARRARHHRGRDLGRHRRRRGRSVPRPRAGRRRRAVSARPHLRRAAPHDDDGGRRQRPRARHRRHVSTIARRW